MLKFYLKGSNINMIKSICFIIMLVINLISISSTYAANIYKPNSIGFNYLKFIEIMVPETMTVLMIAYDSKDEFKSSLDSNLVKKAEIKTEQIDEIYNKPWGNKIVNAQAYADIVDLDNGKSICIIKAKTKKILSLTIVHELMHCKTTELNEWNKLAPKADIFLKEKIESQDRKIISNKLKQYVLEEVHARIMAFILTKKYDHSGEMYFIKDKLYKSYPNNPGVNSVFYGYKMCLIKECPITPAEIMEMLIKDKGFVERLKEDIRLAYEFEKIHKRKNNVFKI